MHNKNRNKILLKIHNMHCASCEVLIEQKFLKIKGVKKAHVNYATCKAIIETTEQISLENFQNAIAPDGYKITPWHDQKTEYAIQKNTKKDYAEIGAILLIVIGLYVILKTFNLLPNGFGISDNISYGGAFVLGLVAAVSSCIAVTGGLLVAVAGRYSEQHPNLSGSAKFKPHLFFNAGRLFSYGIFGALVGAAGSVLTLSSKTSGILTIIVSIVMILLGFQMLKVFPWLRQFHPKMPKFLAHKIHALSTKDHPAVPFFLGAGTFFLPCGFTQALQLYVLSKGDALTGGLTLFAFALGTLPALLSLSAVSSFAKGNFQRYFVKFAGVLVVIIGLFNINNGFALTGTSLSFAAAQTNTSTETNVEIIDGVQIAEMKINGLEYEPSQFTVVQGIPVEWRIDGSEAEGCAQVVTAPDLDITEYISPTKTKIITFTPDKLGVIPFSCTMGMTTENAGFIVVPNLTGLTTVTKEKTISTETVKTAETEKKENAAAENLQKIEIDVTYENGFWPDQFALQKNIPVELTVNVNVNLGGCMSVAIIPEYDVTQKLKRGTNTIRFTPTETGTVVMACSMGIPMASFTIT